MPPLPPPDCSCHEQMSDSEGTDWEGVLEGQSLGMNQGPGKLCLIPKLWLGRQEHFLSCCCVGFEFLS